MSHLIKDTIYAGDRANLPEVVVLPWGATEPHNLHLPYGTDIYEVEAIADRSAAAANCRGASAAVLPCLPFGAQSNQLPEFPLAINLNPTTMLAILDDVAESLAMVGIEKLLILNGHGGNDFYWMTRELYHKHNLFIVVINWYDVYVRFAGHTITNSDGDHANEMETNCMLYLKPELVKLELADDGRTPEFRIDALNEDWARSPRPWQRFTSSSGAGDPSQATAQKGHAGIQIVVEKLAEFLVQLSNARRDEKFPFL